MRYMKDLFEEELSLIARRTNAVKSVKVESASEEYEIEIQTEID